MPTKDAIPGKSSPPTVTHQQPCDVLVLDAALRQSLVTVRSLGRRGLRVAALETSHSVPAFSSLWCKQQFICKVYEGTKDYLANLEEALHSTGSRVLITSSDGTVALIRQHRKQLEQHVCIALAKEPALAVAVSKEKTLEVAGGLGLAVPRGVKVGFVGDVRGALREVGLPAVVKPVESWIPGRQKGMRVECQLITTPDEAYSAVEALISLGGEALFQQFLPGRRESIHLLYAHGQVYANFAQWAKRTNPPLGGTSVLRQSIPVPLDSGKQAERLVRDIELEGYSEVEFRRDSAGTPCLMEINPRLSASIELAVRTGVDFPHLLYQWAKGDRIDVVKGYRTGIWMRYLAGDVLTTLAAVKQRGRPGVNLPARSILDFCTSFLVPMRYDYIGWKDPLPVLTATTNFTYWTLKQVGRAFLKEKQANF